MRLNTCWGVLIKTNTHCDIVFVLVKTNIHCDIISLIPNFFYFHYFIYYFTLHLILQMLFKIIFLNAHFFYMSTIHHDSVCLESLVEYNSQTNEFRLMSSTSHAKKMFKYKSDIKLKQIRVNSSYYYACMYIIKFWIKTKKILWKIHFFHLSNCFNWLNTTYFCYIIIYYYRLVLLITKIDFSYLSLVLYHVKFTNFNFF